jgi:hypothetical protein
VMYVAACRVYACRMQLGDGTVVARLEGEMQCIHRALSRSKAEAILLSSDAVFNAGTPVGAYLFRAKGDEQGDVVLSVVNDKRTIEHHNAAVVDGTYTLNGNPLSQNCPDLDALINHLSCVQEIASVKLGHHMSPMTIGAAAMYRSSTDDIDGVLGTANAEKQQDDTTEIVESGLACIHRDATRAAAEALLTAATLQDTVSGAGYFLLRTNETEKTLVLSVVNKKDRVVHYKIAKQSNVYVFSRLYGKLQFPVL